MIARMLLQQGRFGFMRAGLQTQHRPPQIGVAKGVHTAVQYHGGRAELFRLAAHIGDQARVGFVRHTKVVDEYVVAFAEISGFPARRVCQRHVKVNIQMLCNARRQRRRLQCIIVVHTRAGENQATQSVGSGARRCQKSYRQQQNPLREN